MREIGLEGVVISARWPIHFGHRSFACIDRQNGALDAHSEVIAQLRAEMQTSLETTLSTLESIGLRVLVIAPTPTASLFRAAMPGRTRRRGLQYAACTQRRTVGGYDGGAGRGRSSAS
ncbi:hypothetical protein [Candidatus Accumulibacter meliphilus]|uniref:hypothetical protein n=1 Tax=Candidatus Accumulibacter meliphilus TaxID=2211374 RepID=UPI003DA95151